MKPGDCRVVDTNVLLIANEQHPGVSPSCLLACVDALNQLRIQGCIAIDDSNEILREYGRRTAPNTGNRVGDAFLKWVLQNTGTPSRVHLVAVTKRPDGSFAEFPDDEELMEFDLADRKFVAVSAAHPKLPPILQGSDSKWAKWSGSLSKYGISVEFLCPVEVDSFLKRKRRKKASTSST
ncbi:MAG: hypothetical protein WCE75_15810 [Terracidiphilus sp.]